MISGIVNADIEATLRIVVLDSSGDPLETEAVIDTGYNGYLSLPPEMAASLGLPWLNEQEVEFADGSRREFDVHEGKVIWENHERPVEIDVFDAQPLIGMALLEGGQLWMDVREGGAVTIETGG